MDRLMDPIPTLLIVANGPGEISGWVLPIARELRRRADSSHLRLVLALAPSQFAAGHESRVVADSRLFDHLVAPASRLGLAAWLGLVARVRRLPFGLPAGILHLGGDLWLTRWLAARTKAPAFAYAETTLISAFGHHRAFREIFVPSPRIARLLTERGVRPERVVVTGDPRLDHVDARPESTGGPGGRGAPRVVMLGSSRPVTFRALFPLWAETGLALRRLHPEAHITIAVFPHLPHRLQEETTAPWRERLAAQRVAVETVPAAPAIAAADLVLTMPGTATMEAAAFQVTTLVVVPQSIIDVGSAEGVLHNIINLPMIGPRVRRLIFGMWRRRGVFASLPNRLSGRPIVPELTGEVTAEEVARQAAALLVDEPRRRRIEAALAEMTGPRGASARIAERVLTALSPQPDPVTVKTAG